MMRPTLANQSEDPTQAPPGLHDALESGAGAKNYYAWLTSACAPFMRGTVVEHGAGRGTLSVGLVTVGAPQLILTEPDAQMSSALRARFGANSGVAIFQGTLDDYLAVAGPNSVDSLISSNVLEHIEDDEACLATMRKLLRPGGQLVLYVPARPELYGDFDRLVGHHRRYRPKELRRKLLAAGFQIEKMEYRNLVASLAWLWLRVAKKQHVPGGNVESFDRFLFPLLRRIEDVVPLPYGLNILTIASWSGG
ncbi:MAG: methyltransferase [Polyangiaceae bacterium]|nr:methyltransferase [Polyangiaceae bacterium]